MRHAIDTILGLVQLLRLAALSRFRLRGAYWNWRMSTALGAARPPRAELLRAVLEYGRWVHRMRRMR